MTNEEEKKRLSLNSAGDQVGTKLWRELWEKDGEDKYAGDQVGTKLEHRVKRVQEGTKLRESSLSRETGNKKRGFKKGPS